VAEHGATVSEVTVSRHVARRRIELGLVSVEVAIPQTHLPGAEAEVDFGEFQAVIAGVPVTCWLFAMRLSHSGRAFHVGFGTQAQEAFLEVHVLALAHFGGVPALVRYDNLKPAVTRVLRGRDRVESERFVALRSHYGFDSFFCRPGIVGAHEKGGVEGEIGRFRRRHLVPVPKVTSLAALNTLITAADLGDETWVITGRRYAGRRLTIRLSACVVEVSDGGKVVARHERAVGKHTEVLTLDHYLEVLKSKPGGLPGATALAQAKARGLFTASHQGYRDAARRARGDAAGTRALIEVLLAHLAMPAAALTAAMDPGGCLRGVGPAAGPDRRPPAADTTRRGHPDRRAGPL